jgi:hypothetical protein
MLSAPNILEMADSVMVKLTKKPNHFIMKSKKHGNENLPSAEVGCN